MTELSTRPHSPDAAGAETEARERLAEEFMALIPRLKRRFEAGMPADLRDELAAVTPHQVEALCHLGAHEGATMHDLAQAQGCSTSSATSLADRLLRHGLAERVSDAEDRRVVRLVPTPRAADLIERFRASKRTTVLEALSALEVDEIAQLIRLLGRVAEEARG